MKVGLLMLHTKIRVNLYQWKGNADDRKRSNLPIDHVVAALAKMFVGDLVSAARAARAARGGEEGEPIGPAEFAAAARTLQLQDRPVVGDHKRPRLNGPPVITKGELLS